MSQSARKIEQLADDDGMKPEYDFTGGERGRYAHLFGEVAEDESSVATFWQSLGLEAQRLGGSESHASRTPDFKVYRQNRLIAFCEVKTLQHDAWLDKATTGELTGSVKADPIYNRISNAVHTAARQLERSNPKHEKLNFLVLVNRDKAAKAEDLIRVLTGNWDPLHGIFEKNQTAHAQDRIREEKKKIDLYLWMEPSGEGPLKYRSVFAGSDETRERVSNLLGINPDAVKVIR